MISVEKIQTIKKFLLLLTVLKFHFFFLYLSFFFKKRKTLHFIESLHINNLTKIKFRKKIICIKFYFYLQINYVFLLSENIFFFKISVNRRDIFLSFFIIPKATELYKF